MLASTLNELSNRNEWIIAFKNLTLFRHFSGIFQNRETLYLYQKSVLKSAGLSGLAINRSTVKSFATLLSEFGMQYDVQMAAVALSLLYATSLSRAVAIRI